MYIRLCIFSHRSQFFLRDGFGLPNFCPGRWYIFYEYWYTTVCFFWLFDIYSTFFDAFMLHNLIEKQYFKNCPNFLAEFDKHILFVVNFDTNLKVLKSSIKIILACWSFLKFWFNFFLTYIKLNLLFSRMVIFVLIKWKLMCLNQPLNINSLIIITSLLKMCKCSL